MDGDIAFKCPAPGCDGTFAPAEAEAALALDGRTLRRFWELRAFSQMRKPLYCPYRDCSALMDVHDLDASAPAPCGSCRRENCLECEVPVHAGFSCEQFQSLPPDHRGKEDVELMQLAATQRWRRCPKCDHYVERLPGGCNYLMCRCKHAFCYACGIAYEHTRRTANNAHGQPGCECGLFYVPDPEVEAANPAVAAARRAAARAEDAREAAEARLRGAQPPEGHIVSLRKGRALLCNGRRWVKRTTARSFDAIWVRAGPQMCINSRTHARCPYGVCCGFRHIDDDM